MKHGEKVTSIAAALGALGTLACCLPVSFPAAAATASLGATVASYQAWFLGASVVLLGVGGAQVARRRRSCPTRNTASVVIFAISAVIVLLVVLFPQIVATVRGYVVVKLISNPVGGSCPRTAPRGHPKACALGPPACSGRKALVT